MLIKSGCINKCKQGRFTHINMRLFGEQMKVARSAKFSIQVFSFMKKKSFQEFCEQSPNSRKRIDVTSFVDYVKVNKEEILLNFQE